MAISTAKSNNRVEIQMFVSYTNMAIHRFFVSLAKGDWAGNLLILRMKPWLLLSHSPKLCLFQVIHHLFHFFSHMFELFHFAQLLYVKVPPYMLKFQCLLLVLRVWQKLLSRHWHFNTLVLRRQIPFSRFSKSPVLKWFWLKCQIFTVAEKRKTFWKAKV